MPDVIEMSIAFADADLVKAVLAEKRAAGGVCGNHLSLQHPVFFGLRQFYQTRQQGGPDPLSLCVGGDVDADLSDPGSASGVGNR